MDQLTETAVNAVANLARESQTKVTSITAPSGAKGVPTSIPALIDPKDGKATGLKPLFDAWRDTPERKAGTARLTTLDSFISLTKRHATEDSVIFANTDWTKPSLLAVIDYHPKDENGGADNGKHRVLYEFPLSDEWKAWVSKNGVVMKQAEFAEFIEDHIGELAAPHEDEVTFWEEKLGGKVAYPNELKLLSIGLKVHAETRVSQNVTLQSGEGELTWEETHRDMKGDKLVVPSLFIIQLPPFFMGAATRLPVRLRYRVREGSVSWVFQLYRPDVYVTEQVNEDVERAARETDLPAYAGTPEMSAA